MKSARAFWMNWNCATDGSSWMFRFAQHDSALWDEL